MKTLADDYLAIIAVVVSIFTFALNQVNQRRIRNRESKADTLSYNQRMKEDLEDCQSERRRLLIERNELLRQVLEKKDE